VVKDITAGEIITHEHVKSIRPGFGLPPKLITEVVGRVAAINASRGTPVSFDLISNDGR
jgi:N-acetylneuraminate synthase